jgi:6-phosphofructokinase 1
VHLPTQAELTVSQVGEPRYRSPLPDSAYVDEDRVLLSPLISDSPENGDDPPAFEEAGPRRDLVFSPSTATLGIVTCGGLCPGLNNVIRSVVMTAWRRYGVRRILGFRYGYAGIVSREPEPIVLTPDVVDDVHRHGGTLLGTSRGPQDIEVMVDRLIERRVNGLICIGGDGTMRGASAIAEAALARGVPLSVVAIPKTIDNDIHWVERSFGFATAVEEAGHAIDAAHAEARGALNGIGLVKLMGRRSGYIAAHSALAYADVNFCLVPEVPVDIDRLLDAVVVRLQARRHAVVVVAEGFGQETLAAGIDPGRDASGNVKLLDVGPWLKERLVDGVSKAGMETTVKYLDPSYSIRGCPANAGDAEFCSALGQHGVHAVFTGRTGVMIGYWNQHFTHVPIEVAAARPRQLDPSGDAWQRVLQATGQSVA